MSVGPQPETAMPDPVKPLGLDPASPLEAPALAAAPVWKVVEAVLVTARDAVLPKPTNGKHVPA